MVIKRDFNYSPKNQNRTLHIYLPDDYYESDERYPVMYFFDGHNLFFDEDATYGKSWGLKKFLDGWEKKMIVVGMECSHEGRERLDEYSPYDCNFGFLAGIHGMGKQTMDWIAYEVKPYIDREFRTWVHREATGIAGSSMGGLMATYATAVYNHVFSKGGCISSCLWYAMDQMKHDAWANGVAADTRAYLSWGTEESGGAHANPDDDYRTETAYWNGEAASIFRNAGGVTRMYCQRGGHHCEADWEKLVPDFMNFLWCE